MVDAETQPVDQQVTSKFPTTKPKKPKTEWLRTNLSVRKQNRPAKNRKKALVEACVIIANNLSKETSTVEEVRPDTFVEEVSPDTRNVFSTTQ